ncbi:hypothetical protein SAMN05661096_03779 [Marivirga sericea]|uniref:Uncharacterized protein n=1 Tax=Marivirga sericea TaxID=1028 RepID=A0A1X7LEE2_9BACT|nr:hypothetical protein [Marivirga sericea]SMG51539.1 hypothetical protein SAMN05661096_03779 [Marivirga sericea]
MKKAVKRIFAGTLLMGLVSISGLATIIFFPEPLFANKIEHKQFNVYSNEKIDDKIKSLLDDALNLIKESELYDEGYKYDIFLANKSFFNNIDGKFLGHGPSARATDNNIIIKVEVDIQRNLFFPTFYQKCEGNLTYLIAHEIVHCLQDYEYGKWKFNPFRHPEFWKLEGYPEYVSRREMLLDRDYSLTKEIDRYIDLESKSADIWIAIDEGGCKAPNYYYKSRLMTEYLIDIKSFSYDMIISDTSSENAIYAEMLNWRESINR